MLNNLSFSPSLHLLDKMNTTLGKIAEIKDCDRGYSRLTLTINKPFETKLLKFNVWKKNLFRRESGENFEVGDEVSVNYHFKGAFPTLDAMKLTPIDHCLICGNAMEQINTLRMDCDGCALVPETELKQLIHEDMKLISFSADQYMYSTGYRIKLMEKNAEKPHVCVILGGVQLKKIRIRISNFWGAFVSFVFFRIFYQHFFTLEITKYPREMDLYIHWYPLYLCILHCMTSEKINKTQQNW